MFLRVLEILFFFYFASHIPITLFIDLQALLPGHVYPQPVSASCCSNRLRNNVFFDTSHFGLFLPPAQISSQVVCGGVQRPYGAGSSRVVQVLYFLRGFASNPIFSHRSVCFPKRSVNTECARLCLQIRVFNFASLCDTGSCAAKHESMTCGDCVELLWFCVSLWQRFTEPQLHLRRDWKTRPTFDLWPLNETAVNWQFF